jgi:hypothetical protein
LEPDFAAVFFAVFRTGAFFALAGRLGALLFAAGFWDEGFAPGVAVRADGLDGEGTA